MNICMTHTIEINMLFLMKTIFWFLVKIVCLFFFSVLETISRKSFQKNCCWNNHEHIDTSNHTKTRSNQRWHNLRRYFSFRSWKKVKSLIITNFLQDSDLANSSILEDRNYGNKGCRVFEWGIQNQIFF